MLSILYNNKKNQNVSTQLQHILPTLWLFSTYTLRTDFKTHYKHA